MREFLKDVWKGWPYLEFMEPRTREILYTIGVSVAAVIILFFAYVVWDRENHYRIIAAEIVAAQTQCVYTEADRTPVAVRCDRAYGPTRPQGASLVIITDLTYRFRSPADGNLYEGSAQVQPSSPWSLPKAGETVQIRAHLTQAGRSTLATNAMPLLKD
ncbi:hypothetical protein PQU92_02415 [Asticcacaulis sp. BYS171W]|uniref:DUF3426 domain-containing protein n=1 Tax=Asticcacaulis aquaticus TaxID=2984212 RepID=A0ABT5HPV6_9CAUL|nr:hypothetical protein [Asticcacaulis aquaticus]MDC7682110.1 hypothetical protein [Asticcacaulis aquaticus]